ncbi:MAG: transposase [candidate division WOR-3 bacterium]
MAEDKNYLYLGVDVHKHSSTVTVMDEDGKRLITGKLPNTNEAFARLLNSFGDNYFQAVLEAGRNWCVIYNIL